MSTYKEIVGQKITKVSSDPGEPKTGQMWYNTTTGGLRGLGLVEAFSSASPVITASVKGAGFGPVGGPNIMFGGTQPPYTNSQIEYNGSGWASDGTYPQSLIGVGVTGVSTAAIAVGGDNAGPPSFPSGVYNGPALEYNGSSWTAAPAYPVTSITQIASAGTETAAVFAGGYTYDPGSYTTVTNTNEYNGSSFSSGNAINTGRQTTVSAGTQTAAIMAGGNIWTSPGATSTSNATEQYDGTSWTSVSNHPKSFGGQGFNSKSEDTIINGSIPGGPDSTVFKYDGSSWSTIPSLATGRYQAASGTGSPTNVMCVSGRNPGYVTDVEEYNKSTNTITAAAFSSGTNLPTEKGQGGGAGTQTAAMVTGGLDAPASANLTTTFHYDGSSWTSSGALPSGRRNNSAFGIQTAAVTLGNLNPVDATIDVYNGSSWTGGTSYPSPNSNTSVAGTTTAGLVWGGDQDPGFLSTTNEYNGSWTSANALPSARANTACAGTQTAAVAVGGYVGPNSPSATVSNVTLEYDGTNWSSSNNDLVARYNAGAAGIQTSALIFGGNTPSNTAQATLYDGTSFATQPSLGTARFFQTQGLGATSTVALGAGGQTTTRVATVEEFTGETSTANVANFTTS